MPSYNIICQNCGEIEYDGNMRRIQLKDIDIELCEECGKEYESEGFFQLNETDEDSEKTEPLSDESREELINRLFSQLKKEVNRQIKHY